MNKRILTVLLAVTLVFNMLLVYADGETTPITAVDGNITVNCSIAEAAGKPVLLMILPQELDTDNITDITAVKVNNATTIELFNALPVKHTSAVYADAEGKIFSALTLADDVTTGKYSVVINYIGSQEGAYVIDAFEHVGKTDILNFVVSINGCTDALGYADVIKKDINGDGANLAKEILRKSSANVAYYKTLADGSEIQTEFCEVLLRYKPAGGFDIGTLISNFNKACAFIKLRNDDNTLEVISAYNGTYWDLDITEGSDFADLTPAEQAIILKGVKTDKFTDSASLEADFKLKTVIGMFHEVETREELDELISETSAYASYFAKVREILDDADLNGYELQNVYNAVLIPEKRTECEDFEDIEKLFEDSIPKENNGGGSGGGNGGSGGGNGGSGTHRPSGSSVSSSGGIVLPSTSIVDYSTPFVDVKKTDWAYSYIKELYQNKAITGISATEFAPNAFITRQDFVKILLGVLKIEPSTNASSFTDVVRGSYYEGYVSAAVENGLISGIGNKLFGTGNNILREDAAVIMSRVLKKYGKNVIIGGSSFNDESDISLYAKEAVAHTCGEEIFSGDDRGNFNPKSNLTRAEACAILCRLADKIER